MAVLEAYVLRFGRPLELYTDKASIFLTAPKKNHATREEISATDADQALCWN
jgi:hypothetical protein